MLTTQREETRTGVVALHPHGISIMRIKAGGVPDVADAEHTLALAPALAADILRLTLLNSRAVTHLDRTVRGVDVASPLLTQMWPVRSSPKRAGQWPS